MMKKLLCMLLAVMMLLTAIPALAETQYATCTTPTADGAAYLRRIAGEGQPIVGSARNGDQLIVLKKGNTWHRVKVVRTGVSGWMYGRYITFGAAGADVYQAGRIASAAGYANFRTGAGTFYGIIRRLDNGERLEVIHKTGTWYYVRHTESGRYGYVSANLVALTENTVAGIGTAKVDSSVGYANFRTGPGTQHAALRQLVNGAELTVIRKKGSWYQVYHAGSDSYGYVSAGLLQVTENGASDNGTATVSSSDGFANLRKGAGMGYAVVTQLYNGTKVEIVSVAGNWTRVNVPATNQYGYVYTKLLQGGTAAQEEAVTDGAYDTGRIDSSDGYANLRSGPGTDNAVRAKLYNGVLVSILGSKGSWYRVQLSDAGQTGYVYKDLVDKLDTKGTKVTTGNVNLRTGPGSGYERKTTVAKGTRVSVLSTSGNFARVNAGGWIGYVSLNYLK